MRILRVVLATFAAATAATVRTCLADTALFKISELKLDPASPSPGQDVALTLSYQVPEGVSVSDGTSTYDYTFNFIPLTPTVKPLCEDVTCPINPGSHTNTTISKWPEGITGSFKSRITWRNGGGEALLCMEMSGSV